MRDQDKYYPPVEPSIPSHWYYDKIHYQQEIDKIFTQQWLYVGVAATLGEILAYKTLRIANQNIFIVRNQDNQLKAFYNSCRHRGSVLCTAPVGKFNSNFVTCPYHQWTYSLKQGELKKITSHSAPVGFANEDYGLYPVQLQIWRGLMFVNLNPNATWQPTTLFQDYAPIMDIYPLATMQLHSTWQKIVKCNWKIYWENFSECLHCPNIHPELSKLVPTYSRRLNDIKDVPNWQKLQAKKHPKYVGKLRQGAETWSADGSAQRHAIDGVATDASFTGQVYSTSWPSMFMGGYLDHVRTVTILPLNHDTCELTVEWLFKPETLADKNYDPKNVTEFAKLVLEQDAAASELNQQGLYNKPFKHGVLMPEEYTIRKFYDWLYNAMQF